MQAQLWVILVDGTNEEGIEVRKPREIVLGKVGGKAAVLLHMQINE